MINLTILAVALPAVALAILEVVSLSDLRRSYDAVKVESPRHTHPKRGVSPKTEVVFFVSNLEGNLHSCHPVPVAQPWRREDPHICLQIGSMHKFVDGIDARKNHTLDVCEASHSRVVIGVCAVEALPVPQVRPHVSQADVAGPLDHLETPLPVVGGLADDIVVLCLEQVVLSLQLSDGRCVALGDSAQLLGVVIHALNQIPGVAVAVDNVERVASLGRCPRDLRRRGPAHLVEAIPQGVPEVIVEWVLYVLVCRVRVGLQIPEEKHHVPSLAIMRAYALLCDSISSLVDGWQQGVNSPLLSAGS